MAIPNASIHFQKDLRVLAEVSHFPDSAGRLTCLKFGPISGSLDVFMTPAQFIDFVDQMVSERNKLAAESI